MNPLDLHVGCGWNSCALREHTGTGRCMRVQAAGLLGIPDTQDAGPGSTGRPLGSPTAYAELPAACRSVKRTFRAVRAFGSGERPLTRQDAYKVTECPDRTTLAV